MFFGSGHFWNTLFYSHAEEDEDFDLGFHTFVFGPCRRCPPPRVYQYGQLSIRDDNDLEFEQAFYVGFDSEFVSQPGIVLGDPEEVIIIDDGKYVHSYFILH